MRNILARINLYFQNNPRRIIYALIWLVVLILFTAWLVHFLTTGTIVIKTNDQTNYVNLAKVGSDKNISSKGGLKATVPGGQYVVTVSNKQSTERRIVTIKNHRSVSYTINLRGTLDTEPVLPSGATNIYSDGSVLLYVEINSHKLYKIDSSNTKTLIGGDALFDVVKWHNAKLGLGMDTKGILYSIKDGVVAPFKLPFAQTKDGVISFDLLASGNALVSDGKQIFLQSSGGFSKIFTADDDDTISSLSAADDHILVRFSSSDDGDGDEAESWVVDTSGNVLAKKKNLSAYSWSWSPDGKTLALTSDSSTVLYDDHLNIKTKLPDINVIALTWLNDKTLLYSANGNVFSYNVETDSSSQITRQLGNKGVSGIYPSQDKKYIYVLFEVTSSGGDQTYETGRINIKNPVDTSYSTKAVEILLPKTLDYCQLSYINFTKLVVLVSYRGDANTKRICSIAAKTEFSSYDIDTVGLNIRYEAYTDH